MPAPPLSEALGPHYEDAEPCCRIDDLAQPVFLAQQGQMCRGISHTVEAYRFVWRSTFHGDALVHIVNQHEVGTPPNHHPISLINAVNSPYRWGPDPRRLRPHTGEICQANQLIRKFPV